MRGQSARGVRSARLVGVQGHKDARTGGKGMRSARMLECEAAARGAWVYGCKGVRV